MYFKILSIACGILLVLKGVVVQTLGRRRKRPAPASAYPEKQPLWVWIAGIAGLMLIAVTWTLHVRSRVPYSIVVTLVVTLTLVWSSQVIFNYTRFRRFVTRVAHERPGYLLAVDIASVVLGFGLLFMGLLVY